MGCAVTVFPLGQTVEVYTPGEPTTDAHGNDIPGVGSWESVKVFAWAVNKVSEDGGEFTLRTIDELTVYTPVTFHPGGRVRLPDSSEWEVQGNAEDYNNNPWWSPGLLVVHCRKVEG